MTKEQAAFDLPYFGGFETWTIRVYLMRHGPDWRLGETEDDFTVRRFEDDSIIACGDTKEDAISMAQCKLAPLAEQKAFELGRIDRPYGKRVYKSVG